MLTSSFWALVNTVCQCPIHKKILIYKGTRQISSISGEEVHYVAAYASHIRITEQILELAGLAAEEAIFIIA